MEKSSWPVILSQINPDGLEAPASCPSTEPALRIADAFFAALPLLVIIHIGLVSLDFLWILFKDNIYI